MWLNVSPAQIRHNNHQNQEKNKMLREGLSIKPYYDSKGITLFNCDYRDLLPYIKDNIIDAIVTDPPYATTNIEWDKKVDWKYFWTEAGRICKPKSPMLFFASGKFVYELIDSNPKNYRYDLVWEKNACTGFLDANNRPLRNHESILIFTGKLFRGSTYNPQMIKGKMHQVGKAKINTVHYGKTSGRSNLRMTNLYYPKSVLRFNRPAKAVHPTQKPLEALEWLVLTYSNRNNIIFEPFAGSGTTAVACKNKRRLCIAAELSERNCEITAKRLEKGE
jgi:DNA modification methylase